MQTVIGPNLNADVIIGLMVSTSDPDGVDRDSASTEDGFIEGACHVCLPTILSGATIENSPEALKRVRPAGPAMQSLARRDVQAWELANRTDNAVVIAVEKTGCSVHAVGARPKHSLDRLARILVEHHGFDELENADQQEWCLKRTFWSAPQRVRVELEGFPSDAYNRDVCAAYFTRDNR